MRNKDWLRNKKNSIFKTRDTPGYSLKLEDSVWISYTTFWIFLPLENILIVAMNFEDYPIFFFFFFW